MKYKGLLLSILLHAVTLYSLTHLSLTKIIESANSESLKTYNMQLSDNVKDYRNFKIEKIKI